MRTPLEFIKEFSGREGFTLAGGPLDLEAFEWAIGYVIDEVLEEAKQVAVEAAKDRQSEIEAAVRGLLVEEDEKNSEKLVDAGGTSDKMAE